MLYHLSPERGLTKLTARIPDVVENWEDSKTKRVCFSDSIDNCLKALDPENGYELFVYIPRNEHFDPYKPKIEEVEDSGLTNEVWSLIDVDVDCLGSIIPRFVKYERHEIIKNGKVKELAIGIYTYEWNIEMEEDKMKNKVFEVGKVYQHSGGHMIKVLTEAKTTMYGDCLIGEDLSGGLIPLGKDVANTQNYVEVPLEVWDKAIDAKEWDGFIDDMKDVRGAQIVKTLDEIFEPTTEGDE